MASGAVSPPALCTSFAKGDTFQPFYTGGAVAVTQDGAWCVTTFGTEVLVVESRTTRVVQRLPGVCGRHADAGRFGD